MFAATILPFNTAKAFEAYPTGGLDMPNGIITNPHVFVSIAPDGTVTIVAHRSEMGTGARTSLPMVIADEMEADWARVKIVQAPGDEKYGNQDTDGRAACHHIQPHRVIGAAMREMLQQAAAKQWNVDASLAGAKVVNHEVQHEASGRKAGLWRSCPGRDGDGGPGGAAPTRRPSRSRSRTRASSATSARARCRSTTCTTSPPARIYGADVNLPGQKYAVIARPPVVGKVKSVDSSAALAIPGVVKVIQIEGSMPRPKFAPLGGVAVVANNTWAALQGRDALQIEWDDGPHGLQHRAVPQGDVGDGPQPGKVIRKQGDVDAAALGSAAKKFSAEYYQPHMAHIAMEPPAALVNVADGKVEVWAPVQSPYGTRQDVADKLGVPIENVTVHVTLLGGGFGRKSKCDYVLEAAILSKEVARRCASSGPARTTSSTASTTPPRWSGSRRRSMATAR